MSEWLHGDGWRYHALSAAVFLIVAMLIFAVGALFEFGTVGLYLVAFVALLIVYPFAARKHIFWPPPNSFERAPERSDSRPTPRAPA